MNFDLDEQQLAFEQTVDDFLQHECPLARALHPHDAGGADFGVWKGLMNMGIGGLIVPEAYGGLSQGLLDLSIVAEVVGRYAAPGPFLDHAMATVAVVLAGTEAQKQKWLPGMASGQLRGTIALAEDKGQWTPESWTCTGSAALSGRKRHVLHADGADIIVVGTAGGGLALVEGKTMGVGLQAIPSTDAGRQLFELSLSDAKCEPMQGASAHRLLEAGLVLIAADAYGIARRCLDMAVDYAKLRVQFDKPIGAFQAVKHQLADMALGIVPAQGLYWYAAHAFDLGMADAGVAAALAKSHITELAPKAARRAIESHGGIGYTWEFGLHVWLKRALFDQAYLGMPREHRLRVAEANNWESA